METVKLNQQGQQELAARCKGVRNIARIVARPARVIATRTGDVLLKFSQCALHFSVPTSSLATHPPTET